MRCHRKVMKIMKIYSMSKSILCQNVGSRRTTKIECPCYFGCPHFDTLLKTCTGTKNTIHIYVYCAFRGDIKIPHGRQKHAGETLVTCL